MNGNWGMGRYPRYSVRLLQNASIVGVNVEVLRDLRRMMDADEGLKEL
jgi:hypothetical protein